MSTSKICLYKGVDKKYTGCNLKTTELLGCALIGVYAVIRSNMVISRYDVCVCVCVYMYIYVCVCVCVLFS